jgi:hypothetical protein
MSRDMGRRSLVLVPQTADIHSMVHNVRDLSPGQCFEWSGLTLHVLDLAPEGLLCRIHTREGVQLLLAAGARVTGRPPRS